LTKFPNGVIGISGRSKHLHTSTLSRRVSMLFSYIKIKNKKFSLLIAYTTCFLITATAAYAVDNTPKRFNLTATELDTAIQKIDPHNKLKITASPEVLSEVNHMRRNEKTRAYMH